MTTQIDIVLYEGFDELDAIGPFEVFGAAAAYGADLSTRLVTLDPTETVTASHGLRVEPDGVLADAADSEADLPNLLVIPGGGWNSRSEAGAWAEAQKGAVPAAADAYHEAGVTVASVCTGGMLLAEAGLTDGRHATTHDGALDDLRASGADVVDARVVDDGDILTAGGVTSGLDLALYIVEREASREVADRVAKELEYERRYDVFRAE
ncbi:DJ-1/PfpI family protein [Salinirubrum litoreum]|uniref:DJ-1/PfpI family protein n=1 Tax=Salinirubrum litoreum TaxID=1126234 RepID=A0ABD5R9H2_9EURY|nr:DJ-1/PfpI family protein [Salinirubrum litoreum]